MINGKLLQAQVYWRLKNNSLSAENWEHTICDAMGARWIPGDRFLADGVLGKNCLNIKTLKQTPTILKTKPSRDFVNDPHSYPNTSVEMIQRRTALPASVDERTATPLEIGRATLRGFCDFERESFQEFGCTRTLDVVVRHGVDRTQTEYLVEVSVQPHHHPDADSMTWREVLGGARSKRAGERVRIEGFEGNTIRAARNGSNAGVYQTNYIIWKDLSRAEHTTTVRLPLPRADQFDLERVIKEMEQNHV